MRVAPLACASGSKIRRGETVRIDCSAAKWASCRLDASPAGTPPMSHSLTPLAAWPQALLPCLRRIWTHVLFPSSSTRDSRLRLRDLSVLVLLPAALLYPCMTFHLLEP